MAISLKKIHEDLMDLKEDIKFLKYLMEEEYELSDYEIGRAHV